MIHLNILKSNNHNKLSIVIITIKYVFKSLLSFFKKFNLSIKM